MGKILGLGHILYLTVSFVEFIIVVLPLQINAKGFHHTLKRNWKIVFWLPLFLFQTCRLKIGLSDAFANLVSSSPYLLTVDLVHDSLTLSTQDVLESLQVFLRIDDSLELLEREFVALEHCFNRLFVQSDLILLEQVYDFVSIECT